MWNMINIKESYKHFSCAFEIVYIKSRVQLLLR